MTYDERVAAQIGRLTLELLRLQMVVEELKEQLAAKEKQNAKPE